MPGVSADLDAQGDQIWQILSIFFKLYMTRASAPLVLVQVVSEVKPPAEQLLEHYRHHTIKYELSFCFQVRKPLPPRPLKEFLNICPLQREK